MSRIKQIEEQIAEKRAAILAIDDTCENEARARTEDEKTQWDILVGEIGTLNDELKAANEAAEQRQKTDTEFEERKQNFHSGVEETDTSERSELLKQSEKYDLSRGIRILMGDERNDGLEAEWSQEARNENRNTGAGFGYSGLAIPGKVLRAEWEKRTDIDQSTSAIQPTVIGGYVEAIRQNGVFSQVIPAANILTGLTADYKIPAVGSQSLAWATAENSAAPDGGANYSTDTLAPVRLTGYADVSNRVILQNGEVAMSSVMADFGRETANKIDGALFSTTDITNAIPAIAGTTGVLTFTEAATYAAPSSTVNGTVFDDYLAALQTLANGNAATGALAFVGHTKLMSDLVKSPQVISTQAAVNSITTGAPLMLNLNGVRFYLTTSNTSNSTTSADFIGGNFNFEYVGFFGGLDISIDPYSVKLNDQQRIVVHRNVDATAIRGAAFVKSTTLLS